MIAGSRFSFVDLVGESIAGLFSRPGRAILTILGTALGVGTLVATLGIAKTAGNQIVTRFDALAQTEVLVEPVSQPGARRQSVIPWDAGARLSRLNGVEAAATLSQVPVDGLISAVPFNDPLRQTEFSFNVYAASADLLASVRGTMATGRFFDEGHSNRADPVAVIGPAVANRLNLTRVDQQPAIKIGERIFSVIGIIEEVAREPSLLSAVVMPDGTARELYDLGAPAEVHIDTVIGANQLIARQAPIALAPNNPDLLEARTARDPREVRQVVEEDVNSLFLVLGGITLLVGAIGIANVVLVSVIERIGEIGLRRALGAGRRHIARQFLFESLLMGLIGGVIGASAGVLAIVGASAYNQWTPVLDAWVPLAAPAVGAAVGLIAGVYPSLRAASLEPVDALRAGV
ncbi:MAG: ABC transporter permease [Acidimicrobiia bacterium]|nr:ABC transporter permease [Acidimicrobiia bacterium]NND12470.1 ABC transporter permease [Acidimicrobiia bacterium]NNL26957.1 ABC transporter permease [Acidimicrobiia bacterium]